MRIFSNWNEIKLSLPHTHMCMRANACVRLTYPRKCVRTYVYRHPKFFIKLEYLRQATGLVLDVANCNELLMLLCFLWLIKIRNPIHHLRKSCLYSIQAGPTKSCNDYL